MKVVTMRLGIGFLLAAFLGLGAPAFATDEIAAILANPATYDGKAVTVTGTVAHVYMAYTARTPFASFSLCDSDSACITVYVASHPRVADGKSATATGTFRTAGTFTSRQYVNGIEADTITSAEK